MRKFTSMIKENNDNKTKVIFDRIKPQLQEMYESEARFLEEKLNEFGFEVHGHKILIRDGYKTKAGITVFFKAKDVEYALVDELTAHEFVLYDTIITNNIKKTNTLIQKGHSLEYTVKSLREILDNRKTIDVYYENMDTGVGHEEKIDASDIFDKDRDLTLPQICKELGKRISPLYRPTDEVFTTTHFVFKGKEYKMIGDNETFSITDGQDDDAVDENGKKYPSYRL